MNRLWTPWRMTFIKEHKTLQGCVFCNLPKEHSDEKNLILKRTEHSFIILNKYPYNPGHLMVIPFKHTADFAELTPSELLDMHVNMQVTLVALKKEMKPQGFNVGMNLGEAGGAGIREHMHYHIVPRWSGDSNFMPIFGETKVLPETLDQTYARLKPHF